MHGVPSPPSAAPTRLSRDPVLGQCVLGYQVTALIKAGRTSRIYAAYCVQSGELAALKMLRPVLRGDRAAVEGFDREQAVLRRVVHPVIPRFLASGWFRGVPWYAMGRLAGESLPKLIGERQLTSTQGLRVMWRLCSALDHLHRAGFVHGAISASAVLASPAFDRVALLDLSHAHPLRCIDDVKCDVVAAGDLLERLADPNDAGHRVIVERCSHASPDRYSAIVDLANDLHVLLVAAEARESEDEVTGVFARAC